MTDRKKEKKPNTERYQNKDIVVYSSMYYIKWGTTSWSYSRKTAVLIKNGASVSAL